MADRAVILQPFAPADCARLLAWVDSPEALLQWAGPKFSWPLDERQLLEYASSAGSERLIFKAVRPTGETVGHAELELPAPEYGRITRMLVAPAARGAGIGTAIVRELVRRGFDEIGLHRLELSVYESNAAAIACYERVGFRKEGLRRETTRVGESYWSAYVMGLLVTDAAIPRGSPDGRDYR